MAASNKILSVTLLKSPIGRLKNHKASIAGLGLRKIGQTVELEDSPAIRGMINQVSYLLKIEGPKK